MKRFITGFLFGALLFAVPALANNSKMLEAFYNNIKLSVYGNIVDTEGNEPFIVDGRTYVPARYVAEAMGGVVKWNETENIVEVTKAAPEAPALTKMTSDGLEAVYIGNNVYVVKSSLITEKYNLGVNLSSDGKTIYYWLNNANNGISVKVYGINGGVYISYDDYENGILPFINKN